MTDTPRAAIYVRVSSARQVDEGHSLDEQVTRCRRYVEFQGWTLDEQHVFIERGVSGGKASRPALDRMVAAAEAREFDKLVGGDMDRIGRSAVDALRLLDKLDSLGVEPLSGDGRSFAANDPGSKMTRGVVALAAEFERGMIAERVRRSVPGKRARGSYNGGNRPFGYDFGDDGLEVNETEAEIIRHIFREYNAGATLRAIGRGLNERGIKGPRGGVWSQARIGQRLDMPLYAGIVGGGEQGRHEAIIDAATWARTCDLRAATAERVGKDRSGRTRAGRRSNSHLLGNGLLRCECGASMYPRKDTYSGRDTYRCRGRDERSTDCEMPPLPRDAVDGVVREYIAGHVLSPGMAAGEIEREALKAAKEARQMAGAATRKVSEAEQQLRNGKLSMLQDEPPFSASEWRELKAELEQTVADAKRRETEGRRIATELEQPSDGLLEAVEAIRAAAANEAADAETLSAQRAAIERIFECFEIVSAVVEPETTVPDVDPDTAAIMAAQDAILAAFDDAPEFIVKPHRGKPPRRILLTPMPRGEIAARFGAFPLDSLHELSPETRMDTDNQNVRIGLALRTFGSIAVTGPPFGGVRRRPQDRRA